MSIPSAILVILGSIPFSVCTEAWTITAGAVIYVAYKLIMERI